MSEFNWNILLANFINVFHILIILFVVSTPFITDITYYLILHVALCVSLLVHWWANNNICGLSVVEAKLRGIEYSDSFTHQFVAPMYDISKTNWSNICYIVTISVMIYSIYKIYWSGKIGKTIELYNKLKQNNESFAVIYTECLQELFQV